VRQTDGFVVATTRVPRSSGLGLPRVFNGVRALACMRRTLSAHAPRGCCRCLRSLRSTQPAAAAKNRAPGRPLDRRPRNTDLVRNQISSETAWLCVKKSTGAFTASSQLCSTIRRVEAPKTTTVTGGGGEMEPREEAAPVAPRRAGPAAAQRPGQV
jgi:hypothetical protein